jgi:hypothetical protein
MPTNAVALFRLRPIGALVTFVGLTFGAGAVLRGIMHTPLTQRRRPAVARVAAAGNRAGGAGGPGMGGSVGESWRRSMDRHALFGPGVAYGGAHV